MDYQQIASRQQVCCHRIGRFIIAMFTFLISAKVSQAQLKTVQFDYAAGTLTGAQGFPFDEPFQIKFINVPPSGQDVPALIQMQIRECDRPHYLTACQKRASDLSSLQRYFDSLPDITPPLDFSAPFWLSAVVEPLRPNKYFLVMLDRRGLRELTAAEAAGLQAFISGDIRLMEKVSKTLRSSSSFTIDIGQIQQHIADAVKSYNPNYYYRPEGTLNLENLFDGAFMQGERRNMARAIEEASQFIATESGTDKSNPAFEALVLANANSGEKEANLADMQEQSWKGYLERLDLIYKSVLQGNLTVAKRKAISENRKSVMEVLQNRYERYLQHQTQLYQDHIARVAVAFVKRSFSLGSTVCSGDNTVIGTYMSQTIGAAYNLYTDKIISYASYSVFFRPMNLDQPLSAIPYRNIWDWLGPRVCLNGGITIENISTNRFRNVSGIVDGKALVLGVGYRPLAFLKFDFNGVIYNEHSPNPLSTHKRIRVSPSFGIALNVNLARLLSGRSNSFTPLIRYFNSQNATTSEPQN